MNNDTKRHSSATTLVTAALVVGASLTTAALAPAYLMASARATDDAVIEAIEAAEFGLGEIVGGKSLDQLVVLEIGQSSQYTASPPARRGKVEATITRVDSVRLRIDVIGTDTKAREQYEISRMARASSDGLGLEVITEAL